MIPEITADGSHTLFLPSLNEHYHSVFGAIQESREIFIKYGLKEASLNSPVLNILEMGFGTGLNAFLTALEAGTMKTAVQYQGIEAFPVPAGLAKTLNYPSLTAGEGDAALFSFLHEVPWNEQVQINEYFSLEKQDLKIQAAILPENYFHLVYFDAFSPGVQPELWTGEIFDKLYKAMTANGILVTYSARGSIRRAMKSVGFQVEKLPGPPGKA